MTISSGPADVPAPAQPAPAPGPDHGRGGWVYFTPLPVRMWHWLNAISILTLIATGIRIRFPDKFTFLAYRHAISIHNWAGIAVIGLFFVWGFYYGPATRRLWRLYVPTTDEIWPGLFRQARFYLWGYFRGEPHPYEVSPENKFNPMQKLFYAILMFVALPILCVTGLLLLNVTPFRIWLTQVGGVKLTIGLHYLTGAFIVMFLCIHLYLCTLGRTFWSGFRSMITGWEEHHAD